MSTHVAECHRQLPKDIANVVTYIPTLLLVEQRRHHVVLYPLGSFIDVTFLVLMVAVASGWKFVVKVGW